MRFGTPVHRHGDRRTTRTWFTHSWNAASNVVVRRPDRTGGRRRRPGGVEGQVHPAGDQSGQVVHRSQERHERSGDLQATLCWMDSPASGVSDDDPCPVSIAVVFEEAIEAGSGSIHIMLEDVSRIDAAAEVVAESVDGIEHDVRAGGVTVVLGVPARHDAGLEYSRHVDCSGSGRSPVVTELPTQSYPVPVGGSSNTATVRVVTVQQSGRGPMWRCRCRPARECSRRIFGCTSSC